MPRPGLARGETAQEPAAQRVGVEESSAPGRKGALVRRNAFDVKREIFAVGEMPALARRLLRKRLGSELDAVRDILRKVEILFPDAGETRMAVPTDKDGWFMAAEPRPEAPMEDDGSRAAKRRNVSPFAEQAEEKPRMTSDQRRRLAGRLASLAAVLPDHVVAFLQNQRGGDADPHGYGGEIEVAVHCLKDAALSKLKELLDKFVPESTPKNHERAAMDGSGVSCLSQHQDAVEKIAPVEEDEGEDVYLCGGVSPKALRDIAEEYDELVDGIGVQPLSPLARKYVDLNEQDAYVDICGEGSPVVLLAKAGETRSSPRSRSSDSDASSSDSDASSSDSDSSSSSDSDSDESVSSPPPLPVLHKEDDTPAQILASAPGVVQIAEAEELQEQCFAPALTARLITSSPPAPAALPKENVTSPQPPEPVRDAEYSNRTSLPHRSSWEQENLQDLSAAPAPASAARLITTSPPALAALPKENNNSPQPPEPVRDAEYSAKQEKLQDLSAAPGPMASLITSSLPTAAALHKENDTSAQPPEPAPETVQIADPEEPQDQIAEPEPAAGPITDLIAKAQEAIERRRRQERERARKKARQELLEVERAALPNERIHPLIMEALGIAAFEHIVSTVEDANTARARVNSGELRVAPDCPSILQQLGLFLKADVGGEEREQLLGSAPGPEDMDVEEGEIR
ncbi:uncharacterized protein LOC133922998 [Phragmites australis]|uniref:uncharacterized protein LOC133922998 n=1 Tax=Phragmites australis TaxID=29695 RepID=UPI002D76D4EB|nr:uncharacterized protein LOC133922998 [Phragmites australis]